MPNAIQFYYNPMSRSRIVHWMLEELGEPYQIKTLDFAKGEHKATEFLKINPMGKVPAIVDRGVVVTECAAICAYLADAYPRAQLSPRIDDPARGAYFRWLFFASGPIESATMDRAFPRAEPARSGAIGYGTYETAVTTLETAVSVGPYILGDVFSAADVYVCSQIAWSTKFKWLESRPAFDRYVERCCARPAYQRSEAQANEIVAKLKA